MRELTVAEFVTPPRDAGPRTLKDQNCQVADKSIDTTFTTYFL